MTAVPRCSAPRSAVADIPRERSTESSEASRGVRVAIQDFARASFHARRPAFVLAANSKRGPWAWRGSPPTSRRRRGGPPSRPGRAHPRRRRRRRCRPRRSPGRGPRRRRRHLLRTTTLRRRCIRPSPSSCDGPSHDLTSTTFYSLPLSAPLLLRSQLTARRVSSFATATVIVTRE